MAEDNIHPIFDRILSRSEKEQFLKQNAKVIWLTGLSGSGKSTIAELLEKKLFASGYFTQLLDGDNVRSGINNNLSFTEEDRKENIRRIAEVSKLFLNCGIICINSFVSPTEDLRQIAKDIIGEENFIDIYVYASFDTCAKRDVKGLYAKAIKGEIKNFTGLDAPFEEPKSPAVFIDTEKLSVEDSVEKILAHITPLIKKKS